MTTEQLSAPSIDNYREPKGSKMVHGLAKKVSMGIKALPFLAAAFMTTPALADDTEAEAPTGDITLEEVLAASGQGHEELKAKANKSRVLTDKAPLHLKPNANCAVSHSFPKVVVLEKRGVHIDKDRLVRFILRDCQTKEGAISLNVLNALKDLSDAGVKNGFDVLINFESFSSPRQIEASTEALIKLHKAGVKVDRNIFWTLDSSKQIETLTEALIKLHKAEVKVGHSFTNGHSLAKALDGSKQIEALTEGLIRLQNSEVEVDTTIADSFSKVENISERIDLVLELKEKYGIKVTDSLIRNFDSEKKENLNYLLSWK